MGNSASSDAGFRGCALLLGHYDFGNDDNTRRGHRKDIERLKRILRKYRFNDDDVTVWEDPVNVKEKMNEFVTVRDFSQFSVLVVVVATHGDEGGLLKSHDNNNYRTSDIWKPLLTSCPIGTPKILVFQACRSLWKREVRAMTGNNEETDCVEVTSFLPPLPHQSNFLLSFATPEGRICTRDSIKGTAFLQAWCTELEQAASHDSLYAVMTRVTNRVVRRNAGKESIAQTPCFVSFLLNDLHLPSRVIVSDRTETSDEFVLREELDPSARPDHSDSQDDEERADAMVGILLPEESAHAVASTPQKNQIRAAFSLVSSNKTISHSPSSSNGDPASNAGPDAATKSGERTDESTIQRNTLSPKHATLLKPYSKPMENVHHGPELSDYDMSIPGLAVLLRPRGKTEESIVLKAATDQLAAALKSRGYKVKVKITDPKQHGHQVASKLKKIRKQIRKLVARRKYSSLIVVTLGPLKRYDETLPGRLIPQGTEQWCIPSSQVSRWKRLVPRVVYNRLHRRFSNTGTCTSRQNHPVPLHKMWAAFRASKCPALKDRPKAFLFVDINTEMQDAAHDVRPTKAMVKFDYKPTEHADLLLAKGFGKEYLQSLVQQLASPMERCEMLKVLTAAANDAHSPRDSTSLSEAVTEDQYHSHFESYLRAYFVLPPLQSPVQESNLAGEGENVQPSQSDENLTEMAGFTGFGSAINPLPSSKLLEGSWKLDNVFWQPDLSRWVALVRLPNNKDLAIALELRCVEKDPSMISLTKEIANGVPYTLTCQKYPDETVIIGLWRPLEV